MSEELEMAPAMIPVPGWDDNQGEEWPAQVRIGRGCFVDNPAKPFAPYISPAGISALGAYKYHGTDLSFLYNNVLNPHVYNRAVEFLPMWLAPNTVTLIGFLAMCLAYFALASAQGASPEGPFGAAAPPGYALLTAACILFYQTMDNIDGKQARRTGSSSPLGELFDHTADALVSPGMVICVGMVIGLPLLLTVLCTFLATAPFHTSHWEEYFVGMLIMPKWNGPTEIVFGLATLCVSAWAFPAFWPGLVSPVAHPGLTHAALAVYGSSFIIVVTCLGNFTNVQRWCEGKRQPLAATLPPLAPYVFFAAAYAAWATTALPAIADAGPHYFLVALSVNFGYLEMRLIVQRMCREPSPIFYWCQLVPIACVALAPASATALKVNCAVQVAFFLVFAKRLADQLCPVLGISVFRVRGGPSA